MATNRRQRSDGLDMHNTVFPPGGAFKPQERENPRVCRGFHFGGRYWDRTSDLFRVREARYRCANRPDPLQHFVLFWLEVDTGFEPVYTALQAAASPLGQSTVLVSPYFYQRESAFRPIQFDRMTRFELATLTLAR